MATTLLSPGPASPPVRGSSPPGRFAGSIWLAPPVPPAALRGVLDSEPAFFRPPPAELRSFTARATTRFVVRVTAVRQSAAWADASGRVQVTTPGRVPEDFHVGDELELVGLLALAESP